MATIKTNIFGKISGKLDGYIFYVRNGKQCMRRKPQSCLQPLTPAQVAQQERIASLAVFYHAIKDAGLYVFWQRAADQLPQTGYNLLISQNSKIFDVEGRIPDFSKLMLTPDSLPLPYNISLQAGTEGEWILQWEDLRWGKKTKRDDRLMVVLMKDEESYNVKIVDIGEIHREDCRAVVRIPEELRGYAHLFCLFYSQVEGKSSASKYFKVFIHKI